MDSLTFISNIIKSLSWPTAIVIGIFVLRQQIIELLKVLGDRIKTAKAGGFEVTFGERVDKLEDRLPLNSAIKADTIEETKRIIDISDFSHLPPPYIVSQAWLKLEQAIRDSVNPPKVSASQISRPLPQTTYLKIAREQGLLSDDEMPAVRDLRDLRNLAAHSVDPGITLTDALRYHDVANDLVKKILQRSEDRKPAFS